jgi:hypothetical protein
MADASGSQAVPEPIRVIGIPNGRRIMPGIGPIRRSTCIAGIVAVLSCTVSAAALRG